MNLNHLNYFIAVAKYESITRAADSVHMSQPSVTAAIKELEKEFSLRLFNRAGNKITLTEDGHKFLLLANRLIWEFDDFTKKASELSTEDHITLRLGIPGVLSSFFLKRIVPDFQKEYPRIHLQIEEIPTILGIKQIHDAALDLLIGVSGKDSYANCASSLIYTTELCLGVSAKHPLAKESAITPAMLSSLPLVILNQGSYVYETLSAHFSEYPLNVVLHSNQIPTIKYMLSNNLATILYKEVFENDPEITSIPLAPPMYADIRIFWRKNSYLTAPMKTFISYLV